MNWLRKLLRKKKTLRDKVVEKKTLRDKVVEMYGEEAGVDYDKICQGIPIGGFLDTAIFLNMVEDARKSLEAEK